MSSLAKLQKQLKGVLNNIVDEMDEEQISAWLPAVQSVSFSDSSESSEDTEPDEDEEDAKPSKGKKKVTKDEDEDDEDAKPSKKKKKDEEDEETDDSDNGEEDEDEDAKPSKKKKKDEDDEEDGDSDSSSDDGDEEPDYASMKLSALKSMAEERGLNVKVLIKGAVKPEKKLVAALEAYDEAKTAFEKKSLEKLQRLADKNDVEVKMPRGRSSDDKKKAIIIAALLANGVEP